MDSSNVFLINLLATIFILVAMISKSYYKIQEGLTFDDVLLVPKYSEVLPREVDIKTNFSKNIPLLSNELFKIIVSLSSFLNFNSFFTSRC